MTTLNEQLQNISDLADLLVSAAIGELTHYTEGLLEQTAKKIFGDSALPHGIWYCVNRGLEREPDRDGGTSDWAEEFSRMMRNS
jgi:hypothetical protein